MLIEAEVELVGSQKVAEDGMTLRVNEEVIIDKKPFAFEAEGDRDGMETSRLGSKYYYWNHDDLKAHEMATVGCCARASTRCGRGSAVTWAPRWARRATASPTPGFRGWNRNHFSPEWMASIARRCLQTHL